LKMLHPFMPFITEEIWSFLPRLAADKKAENPYDFLMKADWPRYDENLIFEEDVKILETAMDAIRSIRNIRAEAETAPSKKLRAVIVAEGEALTRVKKGENYMKSLANLESITFAESKDAAPEDVMSAVIDGAEILIPTGDLVDYKAEFERLTKEKARLENEVKRVQGMLANPGFVNKAPAAKIEEEKEKMAKYEDMLEKVTSRLALAAKKL
ncbi:MAG: class I tRNA ligase family protein, partial [Firmicutes bacterium]|nr:class I tRNA ligase family protein [Bacillota bacterium]